LTIFSLTSKGAARAARANVSLAIEHAIHVCALNPRAGTRTDEPYVYRWALGKYRYTLFYRLLGARGGDGIEIARVVHGARVKHLRRLPEDP
jgi:plasmid stabilization system protein ParE